jgi:hypothetical protein
MLQSDSLKANDFQSATLGTGQIAVVGFFGTGVEKVRITRAFGATATLDVEIRGPRRRIEGLTDGRGADVDIMHTYVFKLHQAKLALRALRCKISGGESIRASLTRER